jgi:two-component system C4-dicarboxylate transport sensor histidine kinase DctB
MPLKNLKAKSILYVEDDQNSRTSLSKLFRRISHELYTAKNAQEGLELFTKYDPQIIITDISLPRKSGIQMVKEIRQIKEDAHIIFTTAHSNSEYFLEAIELSVDAYFIKPLDFNKVVKKIQNIVYNETLKLEAKKQELMLLQEHKLALIGELLGNIAHHWRQPLAILGAEVSNIQFNLEMNNEIPSKELKSSVSLLEDNIQKLSSLIDNFRGVYSKNDTKELFNIGSVLSEALTFEKVSLYEYSINVIDKVDSSIKLYGNPSHFLQIFIDLLNNSKYALKNKANLDEKLIFIHTSKDNNDLQINILDNGGGIDEELIQKVFNPYFTTKHAYSGTGLSLYLVYIIVENHFNGTIQIENKEFEYNTKNYKGASVTITIPQQQ